MTAAIIYTKVHGMESLRFGAASLRPPHRIALSTAASSHLLPPSTIHPPHLNCYLPQPASPARLPLAAWQKLHKYNNYYSFTSLMHTASQPASYHHHRVQDRPAASMWWWLASSKITNPAATKEVGPEEKEKRD